jgi:hypothetical protein
MRTNRPIVPGVIVKKGEWGSVFLLFFCIPSVNHAAGWWKAGLNSIACLVNNPYLLIVKQSDKRQLSARAGDIDDVVK